MMQSNQDLEHIFKTAGITKSGQVKLSTEGIYSVYDLISAGHRILNGNIKLKRITRLELIYVVKWIRAFKEKYARIPDVLTEFTKDSFEEFQKRPGEEVLFVNNQMLVDLYVHQMFNGIAPYFCAGLEDMCNHLHHGEEAEQDQARKSREEE
eukprot:scaffold15975_cov30-Attheya_sp.AAC.1